MLEFNNLNAGYGRLQVLFDVSLKVEAGEMVSILGANGAGKSTLIKTLIGAITPTSGDIIFQGERVTSTSTHHRVAAGMAMCPEGRRLFPRLSVRENLLCGTYAMAPKDIKTQIQRVGELFPVLEERSDQRAGSLSGGEQQMLAIGRALMSKPRLAMVDELSMGLAPIVVERLYSALRRLCDRGLAVVMVEQFHHYAAEHSDRQLVLEKGRFVQESRAVEAMAAATAGVSENHFRQTSKAAARDKAAQ